MRPQQRRKMRRLQKESYFPQLCLASKQADTNSGQSREPETWRKPAQPQSPINWSNTLENLSLCFSAVEEIACVHSIFFFTTHFPRNSKFLVDAMTHWRTESKTPGPLQAQWQPLMEGHLVSVNPPFFVCLKCSFDSILASALFSFLASFPACTTWTLNMSYRIVSPTLQSLFQATQPMVCGHIEASKFTWVFAVDSLLILGRDSEQDWAASKNKNSWAFIQRYIWGLWLILISYLIFTRLDSYIWTRLHL